MATMNVSLPDTLKDWVEGQAQTGRYSNASDYVRDLIRRDQERLDKIAAMQKLEFPRAARERLEIDPPVRAHPYKSHMVVYVIEGDDVLILGVRHGHEDWMSSDYHS